MLKDMVDLNSAILAFESVLKIEYEETDTVRVLNNAVTKLENAYSMRIEGKNLYTLQVENPNLADNVQNFLMQIMESVKTVSLMFHLGMFHHSIPISLSTVKYLGLGKAALRSILRYFQNEDEYYLAKNAVRQIEMGLDGIDMCIVKRLFIVLLMLDRLGIEEGVAVLAQYLYYGCVWETSAE